MARKSDKNGRQDGASVDSMFDAVTETMRGQYDAQMYVGGDEESRVICLEVPLVLQYLLQQEGFALGRFTMVVGIPESCKSALGYEFCRLHRQHGGGFTLIETEKKDSPQLRKSITGYDPRRSAVFYVEFIEEWMNVLESNMTALKEAMDKKLRPARSVPWCFVIDSLAGVTTRRIGENIDSEGAASLVQPQAANIISTFMKRMNHWFSTCPFSVIGINHLKPQPDQYGNLSVRNIQGGFAPRFAETLEIEMCKLEKKQIDRRQPRREQGVRLGIRVAKNSLAPHSMLVPIEMLWHMETLPDGQEVQRTYFDWPAAAIEMLVKPPVDAVTAKELGQIIDLHPSVKEREVWSRTLGIPEDSPVSYHEAGLILDANKSVREALYRPLGIRRRNMFVTGVDYAEQRAEAARRAVRIQNDGVPVLLPEDPQRV